MRENTIYLVDYDSRTIDNKYGCNSSLHYSNDDGATWRLVFTSSFKSNSGCFYQAVKVVPSGRVDADDYWAAAYVENKPTVCLRIYTVSGQESAGGDGSRSVTWREVPWPNNTMSLFFGAAAILSYDRYETIFVSTVYVVGVLTWTVTGAYIAELKPFIKGVLINMLTILAVDAKNDLLYIGHFDNWNVIVCNLTYELN
jgi:hypothetical protein